VTKIAGAEHDKNGLQKSQRKCPSSSLALVGSVDDGKYIFTILGQGKAAQPWRANPKQKWSGTSDNNPQNSRSQNEKHRMERSRICRGQVCIIRNGTTLFAASYYPDWVEAG